MTDTLALAGENRLELTGRVVELDTLRYTPAGLPVLTFRVAHRSRQEEAGAARDVEVDLAAKVMGDLARLLAGSSLNSQMRLAGFLAAKSAKNRQPILHVTAIEFLEGN